MAKRDTRSAGIDQVLVEDMRVIFASVTALVAALHLTFPTWKRIAEGKGVKLSTATKVVKEFFLLLRGLETQEHTPDGAYRVYGLDMLEKYRDDILNHRFGKFVIPEIGTAARAVAVNG